MDQSSYAKQILQIANEDTPDAFRKFVRSISRQLILDSMIEEVESLCGGRYCHGNKSEYRRAGSVKGHIQFDTAKTEPVVFPRVRRKAGESGTEEEVSLKTLQAAKDSGGLTDRILKAYAAGVAGRDIQALFPEAKATSSSSVSRTWAEEGAKRLNILRERKLHQSGYVAVFIDGIYLGKAAVVVAALGITAEGNKEVLDFEQGCSESADICATLLTRLKDRGMVFAGRPLFVIDGSTALKNGIRKVFAKALIQRCLVHLERNVQKYLSHKHYGKLAEFFWKLRNAQGGNEGRVALLNLKLFLKCVNHKAYECVRSVGAEAIMVHLLNVPNSLHTTFLSTNNIENIFSSARRKMARVKRWDLKTNMIERWTAYALNDAESGFRRIGGYRELPALIDALQKVR